MSWPLVKLKDVAPAKPCKLSSFNADDDIWQITLDHIESHSGRLLEKQVKPLSEAGSSTHAFDERYVLYSKLRPYLNKVLLPDSVGVGTTELVPMLPDPDKLDRKYLAYYLRSQTFLGWVSNQTAGAKMPRVSMKVFWEHEIPLPTLAEQKRIATILDKADQLRQKRQQAIALADDFLRSAFLDMFGDPEGNGWEFSTVEKVAKSHKGSVRTGPFGSQLLHSEFTQQGVAVLGIDNAVSNTFKWAKSRFISEAKYQELKRYTVKPGDVLITIMGTCGRCAVVPDDIPVAINTKHLCAITLDSSKCLPRFLHSYFLLHPIAQKYLAAKAKGAIMSGLNMGVIKELPVPLVPLDLQQRYEKLCEKRDAMHLAFELSWESIDNLFKSTSKKAFAGEL